ncbi:MAG: hypothetical protein KGI34_06920 [Bradyrhizobium sp.]|nr:hypothetical protein [Bradyrhizobium sp.]
MPRFLYRLLAVIQRRILPAKGALNRLVATSQVETADCSKSFEREHFADQAFGDLLVPDEPETEPEHLGASIQHLHDKPGRRGRSELRPKPPVWRSTAISEGWSSRIGGWFDLKGKIPIATARPKP